MFTHSAMRAVSSDGIYDVHIVSFFNLPIILLPHIIVATEDWYQYKMVGSQTGGNYLPPPIPNWPVFFSIRLACAIWYFAGGSANDIGFMFGILYHAVIANEWIVVQAINNTPLSQFFISYSESLEVQTKIAAVF